jgi:alkylresorcinol/alkylpyrone synthase
MRPVSLLAVETAAPPHRVTRDETRAFARSVYGGALPGYGALDRVFATSTVEERWLARPLDWYGVDHGWSARAAAFTETAEALLAEVAIRAIRRAGLEARDVDQVLCVSPTGFAAPSLDARLIDPLGLRPDVLRTPVFGWGCAGGVIGVARAADLARARPGAVVLLLVIELCSLAFRHDPEPVNVVGSALFGDGAAAAVLRVDGGRTPAVGDSVEHTWPDSLDVMGWRVDDGGFGLELRRDLPSFLADRLRPVVQGFLEARGLGLGDVAGWVVHPGGPKVLDAVADSLDLAPGALDDSRAVLAAYGNASAAGVLMVLRRTLDRGGRGRHLMMALGPGFTAAANLLEF